MRTRTRTYYRLDYDPSDGCIMNAIAKAVKKLSPNLEFDVQFTSRKAAEEFARCVLMEVAESWEPRSMFRSETDKQAALYSIPKGVCDVECQLVAAPTTSINDHPVYESLCEVRQEARIRMVSVQVNQERFWHKGMEVVRHEITRTPSAWYPARVNSKILPIMKVDKLVVSL